MTAVATAVVAVGAATAMTGAGGAGERDTARPDTSHTTLRLPLPVQPSASKSAPTATASPSASASAKRSASPKTASASPARRSPAGPAAGKLYRHPQSQVLEWVAANRGDSRRPLIESSIASQPAAVWFPQYNPGAITGDVRAVTSGAAAAGRIPVLVPYAIPDRDCGGASQGGAPDLAAYDAWIRGFAAGLGSRPVIVILEPDSIALADCLSAQTRAGRFASLSRAARAMHAANPQAKVYFDAGHSNWHPAAEQAAALRQAGAASSGDGIFTNVANFHRTADEAAYARRVLDALGGPARLGAVIDTGRNGNGAPAAGQWCDPAGRALGQPPTTSTQQARIDAYLWVKLPGESDGCKGAPGTFTPSYAYELAQR
ncbi:glycoside hydrolase family 6 protein [Streptomyces sp. NPDC051907]|uniref:glycoside hydrolase family 6 protein n=1 Tax=Streptomyces sp. NPDC051907 TaxID=3155284 RepID=UPI00342F70D0